MADTGNINPLSRTWPGQPVSSSRQSDKRRQKQKPALKKNEKKTNQDKEEGSSRTIDEYA